MPPLKTDLETFEDDLRGSEKTDVEFKTWMDISKADKKAQARIAQHIAAIANSGGGRLYFGVADDNLPQPLPQGFATEQYRSDNIHNLIRTRVHPLVNARSGESSTAKPSIPWCKSPHTEQSLCLQRMTTAI